MSYCPIILKCNSYKDLTAVKTYQCDLRSDFEILMLEKCPQGLDKPVFAWASNHQYMLFASFPGIDDVKTMQSHADILVAVQVRAVSQIKVVSTMLDTEYRNLRNSKSTMSTDAFCRRMLATSMASNTRHRLSTAWTSGSMTIWPSISPHSIQQPIRE